MREKIPVSALYVEDEADIRDAIKLFIARRCESVDAVSSAEEAIELFDKKKYDLLLTDLRMPGIDGLELAGRLRKKAPSLPVVVITAFDDVHNLMRAIEIGIDAFIKKPIDYEKLGEAIRKTTLSTVQARTIEDMRNRSSSIPLFRMSSKYNKALEQAEKAAESECGVLVCGEKSTGRTRLAGHIHSMSKRRNRPLVVVRCYSDDEKRLESEIFGKHGQSMGFLMAANGGSILFSNIDAMPPKIFSRLHQAFMDRQFARVGGPRNIALDVRPMASLEVDSKSDVADFMDTFRDVIVHVPALHDLGVDLRQMALQMLADASSDLHRAPPMLDDSALTFISKYRWPGNFGEMRRGMRRCVVEAGDGLVTDKMMMSFLDVGEGSESVSMQRYTCLPPSLKLSDIENWALNEALVRTNGRKMMAAKILGVDYKRFKRKIKKYS